MLNSNKLLRLKKEKYIGPFVSAQKIIGLLQEDKERNLGPLLLQVLYEEGDLHGAPDLPPDGGDAGLVAQQGVHTEVRAWLYILPRNPYLS